MENIEEKEIEEWTEKDALNGEISYQKRICPHCNRGIINEKEIVKNIFMNIGNSQAEFLCLDCKNKVNFSGEKLIHDCFGWHFCK
jgi:hypothetical protein